METEINNDIKKKKSALKKINIRTKKEKINQYVKNQLIHSYLTNINLRFYNRLIQVVPGQAGGGSFM